MIILLSVTVFIILLYLAYPVWLAALPPVQDEENSGSQPIDGVSVVLLSYNGSHFLKEKIGFLLQELSAFKEYELIIIDDHSNDGSSEIIRDFAGNNKVKPIIKQERRGIPDSMNIAAKCAIYDHIVFCDQRQQLSEKVIRRLVEPFGDRRIGAVSACISDHDKAHCCSRIRAYENYVKCLESRTGNLIGVYGPLYAIRKSSYTPIPDDIILDDLYLSLKIMADSQVRIIKECLITDESHLALNDYHRARRYTDGFIQLAGEKGLISGLSTRQKIMLTWHKYLRLLIPVLMLTSYASMGIMSIREKAYFIPFIIITAYALILPLPLKLKLHTSLKNILKINVFYFFAILEAGISQIIPKKNLTHK